MARTELQRMHEAQGILGHNKCPLLKQRKEKLNKIIIQSNVKSQSHEHLSLLKTSRTSEAVYAL